MLKQCIIGHRWELFILPASSLPLLMSRWAPRLAGPPTLLCDLVRPNIAATVGADMATSGGYLWLIKPHEGANQGNSQTPLGYQR